MVFLVEAFRARVSLDPPAPGLPGAERRAGARVLGWVVVPADEIVFWLFEARTREALVTALQAAAIEGVRISEVSDLRLAPTRTA
jgi:hypothetical protein